MDREPTFRRELEYFKDECNEPIIKILLTDLLQNSFFNI